MFIDGGGNINHNLAMGVNELPV
jgi:hypothetical protein